MKRCVSSDVTFLLQEKEDVIGDELIQVDNNNL